MKIKIKRNIFFFFVHTKESIKAYFALVQIKWAERLAKINNKMKLVILLSAFLLSSVHGRPTFLLMKKTKVTFVTVRKDRARKTSRL